MAHLRSFVPYSTSKKLVIKTLQISYDPEGKKAFPNVSDNFNFNIAGTVVSLQIVRIHIYPIILYMPCAEEGKAEKTKSAVQSPVGSLAPTKEIKVG